MRQSLLEKNRELAWVHIEKNGGRVNLRPLEAPKEKKLQTQRANSHLSATKSGVITHFEVEKGERMVAINDTVYEGDVLVKGVVESGESEVYVGASGAVYADYWMESKFKIPKKIKLDKLKEKKWRILFLGIHDKEREQIYVQQKDLPKWLAKYVSIVEEQHTESFTIELDESKVETLLMPLLHEKIIQSLPAKTVIKKENLLHVKWSDDTVEGKVLFLINENIASPQPVEQGE
ncbi:MAG: sporulation protein YqfD [Lysinibacillus sp.]